MISKTAIVYKNKCKEIFSDFPAASVCVVFAHGSVVIFDQVQEDIEQKAKSILKQSFHGASDEKEVSILVLQDGLKILGWTNQLVTLMLPNKHSDNLIRTGRRKLGMDVKDMSIVHVLKNVKNTVSLGRSWSCMSSILC